MQLDDLKKTWREEVKVLEANLDFSNVISSLEKESLRFDRNLKFRDWREYIACIICIPAWIYGIFYKADNWVALCGYLILLVACITIPLTLSKAKPKEVSKLMGIGTFLKNEKLKLEKQISLLNNVTLWYIAPLYVGIMMGTLGDRIYHEGIGGVDTHLWIYFALVSLGSVGIYYMNRYTAQTKYVPMLERIESQLRDLELAKSI